MKRILKKDGRVCINHYLSLGNSQERVAPIMDINTISQNNGLKHHSVAIWEDITLSNRTAWGSWLSASSPYINSPYEAILFLYNEQWKKIDKGTTQIIDKEFIEATRGNWKLHPEQNSQHPAPFPLRFAERCILLLSYENDVVYDPFLGTGTTAVVAKSMNRRYIGSEISKDYYKISAKMLKEVGSLFTKK